MALSKKIGLGNGVVVNYHRVVAVSVITNQCNIIEVASYTSRSKREEEMAALKNGEEFNVYIDTKFINSEYDPSMNVEAAYNYLKTLPEFEGATYSED